MEVDGLDIPTFPWVRIDVLTTQGVVYVMFLWLNFDIGRPPFVDVSVAIIAMVIDDDGQYTGWIWQLAPEKWWLEDYFPVKMVPFSGAIFNFRGVWSYTEEFLSKSLWQVCYKGRQLQLNQHIFPFQCSNILGPFSFGHPASNTTFSREAQFSRTKKNHRMRQPYVALAEYCPQMMATKC